MTDDSDDNAASETVRVSDALRHESDEKSLGNRLREAELWVFVDANRWLLIGSLSALVFAGVTLPVLLGPESVLAYLLEGTSIAKGYVELQTINVTVITIVLSINQLVLTPDIGSLGTHRSRLDDAIENRRTAAELGELPTTPTDPDSYLRTLVTLTNGRLATLKQTASELDDPEIRREVDQFVADVAEETDRVAAVIGDQEFGTVELLGAAMHLTTAENMHTIRDIYERHRDAIPDEDAAAFTDVIDALELYTVAREYFRSLYVQWEFINFSRAILYLGLPAVVVAHLTIGFVDANAFTGTLLGYPTMFWFETAAFTAVLVPVIAVISYTARLSMLAKTSVFISPFSPERRGGHWEE